MAAALLWLATGCRGAGSGGGGTQPEGNAIKVENRKPGSDAWLLTVAGLQPADDVKKQIKGYGSATSVGKGDKITFQVSVDPPQSYMLEIYRIGWYGGAGGRLMLRVGPENGFPQADCPGDPTTGLIECHWSPSVFLTIPDEWTSGIYLGLLANQQGYASYVTFVVRDDDGTADLLYQQSVTTDQAYNRFPNDQKTGKSLYGDSYGADTISGGPRAVAVSFDRPYEDLGVGKLLDWEIYFVRWLEREGYDVSYSTDLDTHTNGNRLLRHKAFLSVGHDEYWSREMYDAAQHARDARVHLGFFGANQVYWQVRFAPSSSGAKNRVILCYKNSAIDPVKDSTATVRWRDPEVGRAEQGLVGLLYTDIIAGSMNGAYQPYIATNSSHWVYAGTGLADGDAVPGIVGYETDRVDETLPAPTANPGTYTVLSHSPFTNFAGEPAYANSSIYQAPSGAWVFAAGTIGWSRGLDNFGTNRFADPRIQRTTANVLARFLH